MACYHYQHELPEDCLARSGILATLFSGEGEPRFFAGAEVALMHSAVRPVYLPSQDRVQMRGLGNSLAVPQALICLTRAVSLAVRPDSDHLLMDLIAICLQDRIHNANCCLYPCESGWCLCRRDQGTEVLALLSPTSPWGQLRPTQSLHFQCWTCFDEFQSVSLLLPEGLSLQQVLRVWDAEVPTSGLAATAALCQVAETHRDNRPSHSRLELSSLPLLRLEGSVNFGSSTDGPDLLMIIGAERYYFVDVSSPTFVAHLNDILSWEAGPYVSSDLATRWESLSGVPYLSWRHLSGVVVLQHAPVHDLHLGPRFPLPALDGVSVLSRTSPIRVQVTGRWAEQVAHTLPARRLHALGWQLHIQSVVDPGPGCVCLFVPLQHRLAIAEEAVLPHLAEILLQGCLSQLSTLPQERTDMHEVQVQISGRNIWCGALPGHLPLSEVLQTWRKACCQLDCQGEARMYSGPRLIDEALCIAEARLDSRSGWINRRGRLLLTIQPEVRGGGAKDAKYVSAQTALAQLLLDRGFSLPDSSGIVDRLMPKAGLGRIQRLLSVVHPDNKWSQFMQLAQQFEVPIPPTPARVERAAIRVQEAFRKRRQARLKASDFSLQPGHWFNEDGAEAPILKQLFPGCSGIHLCDAQDAGQHIHTFKDNTPDELGLALVGHTCPHEASCSGRHTVPALNAGGEPILLSICLHQLGSRKLSVKCRHAATVAVTAAVCVAFTVHMDEWEDHAWTLLRANPVRQVVKVLQASGISQPLRSPWGRSLRLGQQTCAASEADSIQFHRQVSSEHLPQLLRRSGHNRVYLTPKTCEHSLHPNWAVVWLSADRDQAIQQAAIFQAQYGLARTRKRFGLRVEASAFVIPSRRRWTETHLSLGQHAARSPASRYCCVGCGNCMAPEASPQPRASAVDCWCRALCLRQVPSVSRSAAGSIVSAGRARPVPSASASASQDTWTHSDPWSQYLAAKSPAAPIAEPTLPRQVSGPTAARFEEQEARLSKLEAGMSAMQATTSDLQQELQASTATMRHEVGTIRTDLHTFKEAFQSQLQESIEALRASQQAQQSQMQAGFLELKAMLQPQSSRPSAKRPNNLMEVDDKND